MFFGTPQSIVTGVERNEAGLKVYVGHRYKGIFCLVNDPVAMREIERAWADISCHVFIPRPPDDALFHDSDSVSVTQPAKDAT